MTNQLTQQIAAQKHSCSCAIGRKIIQGDIHIRLLHIGKALFFCDKHAQGWDEQYTDDYYMTCCGRRPWECGAINPCAEHKKRIEFWKTKTDKEIIECSNSVYYRKVDQ